MTYNITKTDGTALFQIQDGQVNTNLSVSLFGRNYSGWGALLDENFVSLLENFAGPNPPNPTTLLPGQLWYDTTNNVLKISNGTNFKPIAFANSATAPGSPAYGDQWWDSVNKQLKAYDSSGWIVIGPASTQSGGAKSGPYVETILDLSSVSHTVVSTYVAGSRVTISSNDATFTPAVSPAITGFASIKPGINVSSTVAAGAAKFQGTAANSDLINNLAFPSPTGQNGKYLTTDGSTLSWGTVSAGTQVTTLDSLTDVVITTPSNGQILKYDSGTSNWVNSAVTVPVTILDETTPLSTTPVSIAFAGAGVTATNLNNAVTVTIPGTTGLGYGQTWTSYKVVRTNPEDFERDKEVVYTNSTGKPIMIVITAGTFNNNLFLEIGGVAIGSGTGVDGHNIPLSAVVPASVTYTVTGSAFVYSWAELR